MKDYKSYYQNLDTQKIVSILRSESDYNSEAISAAKNELEKRDVTVSELQSINSNLDNIVQGKLNNAKKFDAIKLSAKDKINLALEIAHPKLSSSDSIKIKSFSALLIANGLFALISQWSFLKFVFTAETSNGLGFFEIMLLAVIIFCLVAGITFWTKMKIGYYLAFAISIVGVLSYVLIIFNEITDTYFPFSDKIQGLIFSISIVSILIYAIRFLLKQNIRNIYLGEEVLTDEE